jgi:hypothetical protein
MKTVTSTHSTVYSFDDGTVIATTTQYRFSWRVRVNIPPLPLRTFANRAAAEHHAGYFARRAAAEAGGYTIHRSADGRFAFRRPDGTPIEPPTHLTESDAWIAAYADSETAT